VLTIEDLPDDVLLEIFDLFVVKHQDLNFRRRLNRSSRKTDSEIESWQSLVHVCRRWRCLVFGSPRRLNLQIRYASGTPTRKILDVPDIHVWPALPLFIHGRVTKTSVDNLISLLLERSDRSDRISQIDLECYPSSQTEKLWAAMHDPLPELVILCLGGLSRPRFLQIPDSFLGGSAPRLRYLYLDDIPFPGLPRLLLSATHLVQLYLRDIPDSGYPSPEAMATCLSMLPSLETLRFECLIFRSFPNLKSRRPSRSVLPALTNFRLKGANEYLEEFVARIDAPQLHRLSTTFIRDFNAPELHQFISRTPTLGAYDEVHLTFCSNAALVKFRQSHPELSDHRMVEVKILSVKPNRQLSRVAQICTSSLRHLLTTENLYIDGTPSISLIFDMEGVNNTNWLDPLLPFTAVKNLYLSWEFLPHIARTLQELSGGRTTEVLPALQNLLLEGFQPSEPVQEGIGQFISARQLTNHPVAISAWDRDRSLKVDDLLVFQ
jgi:hypothetical protein